MITKYKYLPYILMLAVLTVAFGAHQHFGPDPVGEASRPPGSVHADQEAWSERCKSESPQSPVALKTDFLKNVASTEARVDLKTARVSLVDTGHTFAIIYPESTDGGIAKVENQSFRLTRVEFHKPSEHLLDGRQFEMEANLFFESENSDSPHRALSVNVFVNEGKHNSELQAVWNHLPPMREGYGEVKGHSIDKFEAQFSTKPFRLQSKVLGTGINFDASKLLKRDTQFLAYLGSSTDPECKPGYLHLTSLTPIEFDHNQIEHFEGYYEGNNRDIQKPGDTPTRNFRMGVLK